LLDDASGELAVVDPSESAPVAKAVAEIGGKLTAVLATHHHADHVGGIPELVAATPGLKVYGHGSDRGRIPGQTDFLRDGDTLRWAHTTFRALHVPGHTRGALAYVAEDVVFTGDTLFIAGCGRLFEGTAEMMHRSLNEALGALGPNTRVYCGHEYTVSNLVFAQSLEPDNRDVARQLVEARALRAGGQPTVGATLASERMYNPFLRCDRANLRAALALDSRATDVATFAALRRAKDIFRPPT